MRITLTEGEVREAVVQSLKKKGIIVDPLDLIIDYIDMRETTGIEMSFEWDLAKSLTVIPQE